MTFEAALKLTDGIGGRAAYEIEALRGLWTALTMLRPSSNILEIGCEYGRSTSMIAQVAKEQGHRLHLIDPFVEPAIGARMMQTMLEIGHPFTLHVKRHNQVLVGDLPAQLDMVHIDADHTKPSITWDCTVALPQLRKGGIAVFHDYSHDSLPAVKPTVDLFTKNWEVIGTWHTCHVVKKG